MSNNLTTLNDHLFAQLARLSDDKLSADQIKKEVMRAESIVAVSDQIIRTADITLKGAKLVAETGAAISRFRPLVESVIGSSTNATPLIENKPQ